MEKVGSARVSGLGVLFIVLGSLEAKRVCTRVGLFGPGMLDGEVAMSGCPGGSRRRLGRVPRGEESRCGRFCETGGCRVHLAEPGGGRTVQLAPATAYGRPERTERERGERNRGWQNRK